MLKERPIQASLLHVHVMAQKTGRPMCLQLTLGLKGILLTKNMD